MSTFGDYKAYKKYQPQYDVWKYERDLAEAKRETYLKQHPEAFNDEDVKRGKVLLRAIDIMDEYSQKRAENMEAASLSVIATGIDIVMFVGMGLGAAASRLKPVKDLMSKIAKGNKNAELIATLFPVGIGALLASIAAFPLYIWGAKAEVAASRKGRFEAMRKELNNPNGFAMLTEEQEDRASKIAPHIRIEEDKNKIVRNFNSAITSMKEIVNDSPEYKKQKRMFDLQLLQEEYHSNDKMSEDEIEKAKRDQQILTKLVEKIDIASQDYAENAELAAGAAIAAIGGFGALFDIALNKIMSALKVKNQTKISAISKSVVFIAGMIGLILTSMVAKEASRVGRFKIKQELMKHPEQLVYIDDEKTGEIKDVQIQPRKKLGMFKFLTQAWKDRKEYNEYKKSQAKDEKRFYKAIETLNLTPEQLEDAKRLQKNTFKTFSKVDENSQKYSESVEALGQAASYPIASIFALAGVAIGMPFLFKSVKSKAQRIENMMKYTGTVLLSSILPGIGLNAIITKEQKKASRVADMVAINEMQDYRQFR